MMTSPLFTNYERFFFFFLFRISLIPFLHTANSTPTALTGSGKGRIIWPCSPTVKSHCRKERNSSPLKLRYDYLSRISSSSHMLELLNIGIPREKEWVYLCPTCRHELLPACSSTGQKLSFPGTLGLRRGCPGRSCRDPWPPVPRPSESWWGRQSWWASARIFFPWTHLTPTPA